MRTENHVSGHLPAENFAWRIFEGLDRQIFGGSGGIFGGSGAIMANIAGLYSFGAGTSGGTGVFVYTWKFLYFFILLG